MNENARKYFAGHRSADIAGKRASDLPEGVGVVTKDAAAKVEEAGSRSFRFVVSTGSTDRENDRIKQSGWKLDAFEANPVVLLEHGNIPALRSMPIGQAKSIGVEGDALKAVITFEEADVPIVGPYAEMATRLCRSGALRATSVGFRPLTWSVPKGDEARGQDYAPGIDFLTQELMEISLVGLPANAEALITNRSFTGRPVRPVPGKPDPKPKPVARTYDRLDPMPQGSPTPIHLRASLDMMSEREVLEDWLRENAHKNLSIGDKIRIEMVQERADQLYVYEGWAR